MCGKKLGKAIHQMETIVAPSTFVIGEAKSKRKESTSQKRSGLMTSSSIRGYGKCFRHPTRQRREGRCSSSNLPPNLFDAWELVRFGFLVQTKARFLGCGTRRGTFLLPLRGQTQRRKKHDTASEAQRRQRETPKTPRDMARPLVVPREARAVHRRRSALGFEH